MGRNQFRRSKLLLHLQQPFWLHSPVTIFRFDRNGREDRKGRLWFATEGGGLLRYDPVTRHQHNYLLNTDARQAFNNNIIKAIHISGDSYSARHTEVRFICFPFRTDNLSCCMISNTIIYTAYTKTPTETAGLPPIPTVD